MLKLYCQSCGSLNVYTKEKPKFCQNCGKSFGSIGVPSKLKAQVQQAQASLQEDEDFEVHEIPNIDALAVDIDVRGPQTDTVGGIAGGEKGNPHVTDYNNLPDENYNQEQFQKEAGTLRPPS